MRNWLLKYRISAALDTGRKLPPALLRQADRSPETARFVESTLALDEALKRRPTQRQVPPAEHEAIMRSLRSATTPVAARPLPAFPWWPAVAAATACAALLVAGRWPGTPSAPLRAQPVALAVVTPPSAPGLSDLIESAAPVSVVSPLAQEFDRLGQDLDRTKQFILASLP